MRSMSCRSLKHESHELLILCPSTKRFLPWLSKKVPSISCVFGGLKVEREAMAMCNSRSLAYLIEVDWEAIPVGMPERVTSFLSHA